MKFRKKPVVIEAVQYLGGDESQDNVADFMDANIAVSGEAILIGTLEGEMMATPGDWIIKGIKGEFYPCKPEIFAATHEAVEE